MSRSCGHVGHDHRTVPNFIGGEERPARSRRDVREARAGDRRGARRSSRAPDAADVDAAIAAADRRAARLGARDAGRSAARSCAGSPSCSSATPTRSPAIVAAETGKSPKDALGETGGAIEMGYFVAGEGRRFYGKTTTSAVPNRQAIDHAPAARRRRADHRRQHADRERRLEGLPGAAVRQRRRAQGVARTRRRPRSRSRGCAAEAGLPPGVLNVVQGFGPEAGQPLVEDPRVGARLVHRLDRGRPDDRPRRRRAAREGLPRARRQEPARRLRRRRPRRRRRAPRRSRRTRTPASAARRAAGSSSSTRVYDEFKASCCSSAPRPSASARATSDDLGPVINERQLENMLAARARARRSRAPRSSPAASASTGPGYFMAPTLIEGTRRRSTPHGAVRADHDAAPRRELRRGDRARQRDARTG